MGFPQKEKKTMGTWGQECHVLYRPRKLEVEGGRGEQAECISAQMLPHLMCVLWGLLK